MSFGVTTPDKVKAALLTAQATPVNTVTRTFKSSSYTPLNHVLTQIKTPNQAIQTAFDEEFSTTATATKVELPQDNFLLDLHHNLHHLPYYQYYMLMFQHCLLEKK